MRTRALTSRWAVRASSLSFALTALLLAVAPAQAQGPRNAPAQYTVTDGTIFDRSAWINGRTPSSSELASLRTAQASRSRAANKAQSGSGQNRNTYSSGRAMGRGGIGRGTGGIGLGGGLHGGGLARARVPVFVPPTLPILPSTVTPARR